jgi:transcriptional regulator GlxA family with amidase domain
VAAALQLIEDHLGEDLPNDRLAAACGLGRDRFPARFRADTGQSPAQYVLDRRLAVAAERLLTGDEPIDGIAAACGFPNRFYFTRRFSQRFGIAPAAFRRRGLV